MRIQGARPRNRYVVFMSDGRNKIIILQTITDTFMNIRIGILKTQTIFLINASKGNIIIFSIVIFKKV